MAWGSAGQEDVLSSILCTLISGEPCSGAVVPVWPVPTPGGISSLNAPAGQC